MTVTVVANPSSGDGRAGRLLPQTLAMLRAARIGRVAVHRTIDWADAVAVTRRIGAQSAPGDSLVVVGGDGLAHLGLNACVERPLQLAIVPAGTGNDLARGFGQNLRRPLASVEALLAERFRPIDLIDTGAEDDDHAVQGAQRFVGSVVASGFDALVNAHANRLTRPRGSLRYAIATLAELPSFAPLPYRLELDGVVREVEAMLVAVGNTTSYGGGMRICPDAEPDDETLDLTIVHAASRALLVRLLPQMYTGRFVRHPVVECVSARRVVIDGRRVSRAGEDLGPLLAMGDGEPIGALPRTLSVVPGAVRIAAPA